MTVFRTYFTKNNTLNSNNYSNFGKNPVTEISHYGIDLVHNVTRFIFDIDIDEISQKLLSMNVGSGVTVKHTLNITNTVRYSDLNGNVSYDSNILRDSSFSLEVYNINQDWSEGNGYTFTYIKDTTVGSASNWVNSETDVEWELSAFTIFNYSENTINFDSGNENIVLDITDYINDRLQNNIVSYGIMLRYPDNLENEDTTKVKSVGFHTRHTNTVFEPYIETSISDVLHDDRNDFKLNVDNKLYINFNNSFDSNLLTFNSVKIIDNNDNLIYSYISDDVKLLSNNNYYINVNLDSTFVPDNVICYDVWNFEYNGKTYEKINEFFVKGGENLFFNKPLVNINNYNIKLIGIFDNEFIKSTNPRRITLKIKSLNNKIGDFTVKYRLYYTVSNRYDIDVIPLTDFNRNQYGYYFDLDTSWLLPQSYFIEYLLIDEYNQTLSKKIMFNIPSENILE